MQHLHMLITVMYMFMCTCGSSSCFKPHSKMCCKISIFYTTISFKTTVWRIRSSLSTSPPVLTYLCYVQAVLLGSVVPVGGDGGHVQAVDLPNGRVAAVEVAAVGAGAHVVRTLVFGPLTVNIRGEFIYAITLGQGCFLFG